MPKLRGRYPSYADFWASRVEDIFAILADDFDGDGHVDVLVAGNFHGVPPVRGRYDATCGLFLRGDGAGRGPPRGERPRDRR